MSSSAIPLRWDTELVRDAAEELGISFVQALSDEYLLVGKPIYELQLGDHRELYHPTFRNTSSSAAAWVSFDKTLTAAMLDRGGLSINRFRRIEVCDADNRDYIDSVFESLTKPIVVKPSQGYGGNNVWLNINSKDEYLEAVPKCVAACADPRVEGVTVEEMFEGAQEYRFLATRDRVVGVLHRLPANVDGDGLRTIAELVAAKNAGPPARGEQNEHLPPPLGIGDIVHKHLGSQGLTVDSVPDDGTRVFLRINSNISTGGDYVDMTDFAHPSAKDIAVQAVRAIPGFTYGGVDLMTHDLRAPQTAESYRILEINPAPGFAIHEFPMKGRSVGLRGNISSLSSLSSEARSTTARPS